MRYISSLAGGLALIAAGAAAQPVPATAPLSTSTFANLCAAPHGPGGAEGEVGNAQGFCRGFLIGVWQYHAELTRPGGRVPIFCLPAPGPSVQEVQASFVAWSASHPQNRDEKAVDGLLRWAADTYPCPTPEPAPAARRRR